MRRLTIKLSKIIASIVVLFVIAIAALSIVYPRTFKYFDYRTGLSFPLYGIQKKESANGISFLERDHCKQYREECHCLIFFHGVGETANSFGALLQASSSEWLYPLRLISVNIPDATYLAIKGIQHSLKEVSENYLAFLEDKSCTTHTLIGNSLGGMVVSRLSIDHQDKVDALVLINAAGLPGNYDYVKKVLNSAHARDFYDFYHRTYFNPPQMPDFFWSLTEDLVWSSRKEKIIFPDTIPDLISHQEFESLQIPTLILWGKEDRVLPDFAPEFQRYIASSQISYIDNCGHVPQKECPEAVIKGIKRLIHSSLR